MSQDEHIIDAADEIACILMKRVVSMHLKQDIDIASFQHTARLCNGSVWIFSQQGFTGSEVCDEPVGVHGDLCKGGVFPRRASGM